MKERASSFGTPKYKYGEAQKTEIVKILAY
jgi:hypothetical protein